MYDTDKKTEFWAHLSPQKQVIFSILKANLNIVQNIYFQQIQVLEELHADWSAFHLSWPAGKHSHLTFEFAVKYLSLLDNHDQLIIQHITT